MKRFDVTALGELLIDFTESGLSPQGNMLLEANPGGAPCNVLSMLGKLGRKTCFIGKVGKDAFGDLLEKSLDAAKIASYGLKRDETVHTTLAFVHTKEDGDREFSFYRNPGADMMLSASDVDLQLIRDARIFHFGTLTMTHEGCREATKLAVRTAREAGNIISFDPNLREPLWDSLETAREQVDFGLRNCHILKISDNEILWFTKENDYDKAIEALRRDYDIPLILLSMGKDGSRALCEGADTYVPAFINPATVETTGAGDTFCACVLSFVLDNWDRELKFSQEELTSMLRFANAAASIITTRKGALMVMPSPGEIQALLTKHFT